jgi:hypothetical protein
LWNHHPNRATFLPATSAIRSLKTCFVTLHGAQLVRTNGTKVTDFCTAIRAAFAVRPANFVARPVQNSPLLHAEKKFCQACKSQVAEAQRLVNRFEQIESAKVREHLVL